MSKYRRRSRAKRPNGLPKGAYRLPTGGYVTESSFHCHQGPISTGDRETIRGAGQTVNQTGGRPDRVGSRLARRENVRQ